MKCNQTGTVFWAIGNLVGVYAIALPANLRNDCGFLRHGFRILSISETIRLPKLYLRAFPIDRLPLLCTFITSTLSSVTTPVMTNLTAPCQGMRIKWATLTTLILFFWEMADCGIRYSLTRISLTHVDAERFPVAAYQYNLHANTMLTNEGPGTAAARKYALYD